MSVRTRLTAWYVVVTAAFLIVFGTATYLLLVRTLQRRLDATLLTTARSFEHAVRVEMAESVPHSLERVMAEEAAELPFPDRAIAVFRADGSLVTQSSRLALPRVAAVRAPQYQSIGGLRIYAFPLAIAGRSFTVIVARKLDDQQQFLGVVRMALLVGIPLWTAFAGAVGSILVARTLRPVMEMSEQQRRFMADASHELRTPVAIVRGEAEVALSKSDRGADELRESLGVIEQESRLLSSVIEDLFLLARADAGHAVLAKTRFYLDELVSDAVRSLRSVAAKKSIAIETSLAPESVIDADERLLRRLVVNLVDNAIKFSGEGARVDVTLTSRGGYVLEIEDAAPPIAPADRQRIFERFYRGGSTEAGAGLGLPIAQSIAHLHGASITLRTSARGNVFRVELPVNGV